MSETTAAESQADAEQQPQAGTPQQSQADNAGQADQPPAELTALQRELQEVRREAAKYRTEKQKLEQWKTEREQAEMSEGDKLKQQVVDYEKRVSDMQRELQDTRLRSAVESTAARLGFANPTYAPRLIDAAKVEFDDSGAPTNVEALLSDLLKAEAWLASPRAAGTANGGVRAITDTNVEPGFGRLVHAYESSDKSS